MHTWYLWGLSALGPASGALTLLWRRRQAAALTDALTGLANRDRFDAVSHRSLLHAARTGTWSAVLVIDMNGFAEIAETLGRAPADQVLTGFAEVLRQSVPAPGLPARLGGDRFAVLLTDLAFPGQAYEAAGRIAAAMGTVAVAGRLVPLAAGIGVAVSAPGELTHDELVHRADAAMRRAKALGPDTRWAVWQDSPTPEAVAA
ncbi:putative signaling protein [Actinoplanes sp. SE50]|uniref:GGDEF domain-containing protein n=1 Tax=unclassified Actinoplanes TaxID=2626549 RepID=UPI00023EC953|nr:MULTISPECIES: GGDEF domain-containing protein [unclassified Actinoplanes]AEV83721.1 putative signaling protein [Actinoplanes sp. SE50/110]ATO82135.1 putative signaling protein [Actinoplanes sp. SE50]SLL99542.1 putative signaling protein [Actinoplanes sp. SE50/110]